MPRFDAFTEHEQGLLACALYIAIEQWRKDIELVPCMKEQFEKQIAQAEGFRTEIGY